MTMTETDRAELLTIPEAAEWMRVPRSWLYTSTKSGRFPCVRMGKYVRIRKDDIVQWIAAGGRGPGDEDE